MVKSIFVVSSSNFLPELDKYQKIEIPFPLYSNIIILDYSRDLHSIDLIKVKINQKLRFSYWSGLK